MPAAKKAAVKNETKPKGRNDLKSAKQALAAKYEHLAIVANSKPKQQKFKHRAEAYRRQTADLERRGL